MHLRNMSKVSHGFEGSGDIVTTLRTQEEKELISEQQLYGIARWSL